MQTKQSSAIDAWMAARGLSRLPESSYGEHVGHVMVPVPGRKARVRVACTMVSLRAMFAARAAGAAGKVSP